jgi:hypothetical protein
LDALKQIEIAGACVLRGRQKKCVLVFGGKWWRSLGRPWWRCEGSIYIYLKTNSVIGCDGHPIDLTCLLTYLLTPWSRVLLEKLTSKLCS